MVLWFSNFSLIKYNFNVFLERKAYYLQNITYKTYLIKDFHSEDIIKALI